MKPKINTAIRASPPKTPPTIASTLLLDCKISYQLSVEVEVEVRDVLTEDFEFDGSTSEAPPDGEGIWVVLNPELVLVLNSGVRSLELVLVLG